MTKRKAVGWLVFAALLLVIILELPPIIGNFCYLAAKAYKSATVLNPRFARAYVDLGSSYIALKNYEAAEQAYLKASSIRDESCASCGLGITYHRLGRDDAAAKAFDRAISLNPEDVCAYQQAGIMYYDLEQYQKAIAAFKRVVSLRQSFGDYIYLGNAYVWVREFEPAVDAYKQAIRLNPNDARGHVQLGIAYDYLRRYAEAVDEYQQAIKLDTNDESAHYALALAYLGLRNRPAAFAEYEILRKINPDKAAELFADPAFTRRASGLKG
jgi:tetratricopeptide (TPR) repeat protein